MENLENEMLEPQHPEEEREPVQQPVAEEAEPREETPPAAPEAPVTAYRGGGSGRRESPYTGSGHRPPRSSCTGRS